MYPCSWLQSLIFFHLSVSFSQVQICSNSAPPSHPCLLSQHRGSPTLTCTTPALSPTPPTHLVQALGVSAWRVFLPPPATQPTCLHRTLETRTKAHTSRPTRPLTICTTAPAQAPISSPWFLQAALLGARSENGRQPACWLPAQQQVVLRGQEVEPGAWSVAAMVWRLMAATAIHLAPWAHRDAWTNPSGGLTEEREKTRRVACFFRVSGSHPPFWGVLSFLWDSIIQLFKSVKCISRSFVCFKTELRRKKKAQTNV